MLLLGPTGVYSFACIKTKGCCALDQPAQRTIPDLNLELVQLNCRNAQTDKRRENASVAASRLWVSLFAAG